MNGPGHQAPVPNLPPHHHHPFDRLPVAQTMTAPVHRYTVDPKLVPYTDLVRPT